MIYFKGLNGIRAIAALIVVVWHTAQFSRLFNLHHLNFQSNSMAGYAVDMFFVLSGFLITYLLLAEKEKTKTIDLKKFYLRRIFRIWPLYYLAIILTLIFLYLEIIPPTEESLIKSLTLYLFLMANIAYVLNLTLATITPLWSVGVEEQFYLIWPLIIKKSKRYLLVFTGVICSYLAVKLIIYIGYSTNSNAYRFIGTTKIDIMAIGSIGAYLVFTKNKYLKLIYRKDVELLAWLVLIISCIYKPIHVFSFIDAEVNSFVYLIIILNVSSNIKAIISLENKFFNFLGKISYGIYIYHMFVIYLISYFIKSYNIEVNYIVIFPAVLFLTIGIAKVSYHFFEAPFLKLKHNYSVIKSTNEKPNNK